MMKYLTRFSTLLALVTILAAAPGGQSLDEIISSLEGLSAQRLELRSEVPEAGIEDFPAVILQEAVLLGYSRWSLGREGETFELKAFEMLDPQAAFGLFSRSRRTANNGERTQLGVDSWRVDRTLHFWRGHFFFRLEGPEGSTAQDLVDLARQLVEAIEEPNLHPMSVVQLPVQGLHQQSVEFFLGAQGLAENPDFPAALRDVIGFKDSAEVAMGRYGSSRRPLFLIGYPTASVAEDYFARIQAALGNVIAMEGIFSKRSGLLISLSPGPQEEAAALLEKVRYTASVRWLYNKDDTLAQTRQKRGQVSSFLGTVTAAILFTGVFILAVAGLGLLVGLLRFWLIRRVPAFQHRDEMVRLDLGGGPTSRPL